MSKKSNVIFVFADQLRFQVTGLGGDKNIVTPNLDQLATEGASFSTAVSGCPVCCPARSSLLSGQYPDRHGVFVNDVCLNNDTVFIAESFFKDGYDTAYIGKWHVDGHGRQSYVPPERRHGFKTFRALECTHDYNNSLYYADNEENLLQWKGYDATAQTIEAQQFIINHSGSRKRSPFFMMLSWGPPHNPYDTAPDKYCREFSPENIQLRPNVPNEIADKVRKDLAGYYAHILALDNELGNLRKTLKETGLEQDTLLVFWSDHGDMLGSQGEFRKQRPWDESIRVPLIFCQPGKIPAKRAKAVINTPDIMPTILALVCIKIPDSVQGNDYSQYILSKTRAPADTVLLACYHPFGEYSRLNHGGREYRGIRTLRYTYVRDLSGPWLFYDNEKDPFQLDNLVNQVEHGALMKNLDIELEKLLQLYDDEFLPGDVYINRWSYQVDKTGTVPYYP